MFLQGYEQGVKLVTKLNTLGLISKVTDIAAIMAYDCWWFHSALGVCLCSN